MEEGRKYMFGVVYHHLVTKISSRKYRYFLIEHLLRNPLEQI